MNVEEAFSEDSTICLAFPLLIILAFILFSMAKEKQDKRVAHPSGRDLDWESSSPILDEKAKTPLINSKYKMDAEGLRMGSARSKLLQQPFSLSLACCQNVKCSHWFKKVALKIWHTH